MAWAWKDKIKVYEFLSRANRRGVLRGTRHDSSLKEATLTGCVYQCSKFGAWALCLQSTSNSS